MGKESFEEMLLKLKVPDIPPLKHETALKKMLEDSAGKAVLNSWWLGIPLYLVAAFVMKSAFMPGVALFEGLHDFIIKEPVVSAGIYLVIPIIFSFIQIQSILSIYKLTGKPSIASLFTLCWINGLLILLNLCLIIFYLF